MRTYAVGLLAIAIAFGPIACTHRQMRRTERTAERTADRAHRYTREKSARCTSKDGSRSCACHVKCVRTQNDCSCDDGRERDDD
jgi:hypothetical protein